jgi:hypothetical protein
VSARFDASSAFWVDDCNLFRILEHYTPIKLNIHVGERMHFLSTKDAFLAIFGMTNVVDYLPGR